MSLLALLSFGMALRSTGSGEVMDQPPGMDTFREMVFQCCPSLLTLCLPSLCLPRARGKRHCAVGLEGANLICHFHVLFIRFIELCYPSVHYGWMRCLIMQFKCQQYT